MTVYPAWWPNWRKKNTSNSLSFVYGLLVSGGTAGYTILTIEMLAKLFGEDKNGIIDKYIPGTEIDWVTATIALASFISVIVINGLLVREDVDRGVRPDVWAQNKDDQIKQAAITALINKHESAARYAWWATFFASFVMALIMAYGLQATLDAFIEQEGDDHLAEIEDPARDWKPWINIGIFTFFIWYAEFRLNLRHMQATFAKIAEEKSLITLLPDYSEYTEGTRWRYNLMLTAIVIGLLGTVLVCTPTLAQWMSWITEGDYHKTLAEVETNSGSEAFAFISLFFIAMVQVPLYMDRAKGLIDDRKITSNAGVELQDVTSKEDTAIKGPLRFAYNACWIPNAVFNAPLAMLGVAGTIATFQGKDMADMLAGDTLKMIGVVLGLFLLGAFGASVIVNSQTPPKLPDTPEPYQRIKNNV